MQQLKFTLLRFFLALWAVGGTAMAQTSPTMVRVNNGNVADIVVKPFILPNVTNIVQPTPLSLIKPNNLRSSADPRGSASIWLEFGDGGYTTNTSTFRAFLGTSPSPFLVAVPLYDTIRGKDGFISQYITGSQLRRNEEIKYGPNTPLLRQEERVRLTAHVNDLVQNEPTFFAITYQLPDRMSDSYYVLLYYNNVDCFEAPFNSAGTIPCLEGTPIRNLRTNNGQSFYSVRSGDFNVAGTGSYKGFVAIKLDSTDMGERNVFLTLKALSSVKLDTKTTVMAFLVSGQGAGTRIIDSDTLNNMLFAPSYDPNDLQQLPVCMQSTKKDTTMSYRIRFENIGKGNADMVRIRVKMPAGYNHASFKLANVVYAGMRAEGFLAAPAFENDSLTFLLTPNAGAQLLGIDFNNGDIEKSKGEINFTAMIKAAREDSSKSQANIWFRSIMSTAIGDEIWENPVPTNQEVSYFAKDCNCSTGNCGTAGCYIIFGLCWWWWLLILLALLLLLWWMRR